MHPEAQKLSPYHPQSCETGKTARDEKHWDKQATVGWDASPFVLIFHLVSQQLHHLSEGRNCDLLDYQQLLGSRLANSCSLCTGQRMEMANQCTLTGPFSWRDEEARSVSETNSFILAM